MPLSPAVIDQVKASAFGRFGQVYGSDDGEIVDRIVKKLGLTTQSERTSVYNYVRSARRAFEAGQAANLADPATPLAPTVRDSTIPQGETGYRFRIVVTVNDPQTMQFYTTLAIIDTDQQLTRPELEARARGYVTGDPSQGGLYESRGPLSQDVVTTFEIISAGRA